MPSRNEILIGDAATMLREIPDASVDCCVTSPPYWGLRNYGHPGQIGSEKSPEQYVEKLVEVFRDVRRVLREHGTLWLNLGDCYATGAGSARNPGGKCFGKSNEVVDSGAFPRSQPNRMPLNGFKPKDLVGIPWRTALALQADGWYLRCDVIWNKPNAMPDSTVDRPTRSHEYIFMLTKSRRYFYDLEASREAAVGGRNRGGKNAFRGAGSNRDRENGAANRGRDFKDVGCSGKRNRRSVWTVPTKPFRGAHFATFPPDLIEPCVLISSPIGGMVLDPFFGAGTTGVVAMRNGRQFIGIELNEEYARIARERLSSSDAVAQKR